jgi:hypothetical protein
VFIVLVHYGDSDSEWSAHAASRYGPKQTLGKSHRVQVHHMGIESPDALIAINREERAKSTPLTRISAVTWIVKAWMWCTRRSAVPVSRVPMKMDVPAIPSLEISDCPSKPI